MTRRTMALGALIVLLVLAVYYFLLWKPRTDEIAAIEEEIVTVETQQIQSRGEIVRLEGVRTEAADIEAGIAAARSIVPDDPALPGALRQLQLAADDAGVTLLTVAPGQPAPVEGDTAGLSTIPLTVQLSGDYFPILDFLRRIEQPGLTARGIEWNSLTLGLGEDEGLSAALSGEMYAVLPVPVTEEADSGDTATPVEGAEDTETAETAENDEAA